MIISNAQENFLKKKIRKREFQLASSRKVLTSIIFFTKKFCFLCFKIKQIKTIKQTNKQKTNKQTNKTNKQKRKAKQNKNKRQKLKQTNE